MRAESCSVRRSATAAMLSPGLPISWAQIDDAALGAFREAEADSHGLTVLPFLSGERSPLWSDTVTGIVAGLTLSTDRARIQRAVMESVSLRMALLASASCRIWTAMRRSLRMAGRCSDLRSAADHLRCDRVAADNPLTDRRNRRERRGSAGVGGSRRDQRFCRSR